MEEASTANDFRKHVVHFYNKFAGLYDLTEFSRKSTRKAVLRASECKPGDRMLDVCTGTGELALAFARHGVHTAAIDLAHRMLVIGSNKSSLKHLHFLETDATQLPFSSKSFDVVVISLALHHMPETVQIDVMKEMTRLASKKVLMLEWHAPRKPRWQGLKSSLVRLVDESEHLPAWMRQDFVSTCNKAGLEVQREEVISLGFHRLTVCRPL